jgi:general secretion pathway protein M
MRPLSDREQKLVALGLLVLAVAVIWLGLVSPILAGFGARALEREQLTAAYSRNQRIMAGFPVWRSQLDQQARDAGRFAILAPTPALASDLLRERLTRTFTALGAEITSVQDLAADAPKGWVAARIDLRLTEAQLKAGLERLENEEPYVLVDYFAVAAERAFETGRAGPVDVRIDVRSRHRPPRRPS